MVEIAIGEAVRVGIEASAAACCRYTVYEDGEAVVSYETITDPRSAAGQLGLRNIVYRRTSGLEKSTIERALRAGIEDQRGAIDALLGPRE